jgi:hypothetical protein
MTDVESQTSNPLANLVVRDVVNATHPVRPRARHNPPIGDSQREWSFVGIKWVLRDPRFLVAVTRSSWKTNLWRVRVWLRTDLAERKWTPICDEEPFHTVRGAEWTAYDALAKAGEVEEPVSIPWSASTESIKRGSRR